MREAGAMDEVNPLEAINGELNEASKSEKVGMFVIKTANRTVEDAQRRPDPEPMYLELWYEGEVCCLFADSNLGKSIYAVQMAAEIALRHRVLYIDCELSDKQFQLRYSDPVTGERHEFPDTLFRAEIDPMAMVPKDYEAVILHHIEMAALQLECDTVIVDNISYLCNNMDKGSDAGTFMQNLKQLKMKHDWSLLVIAHTPKRSLSSPITQNDLAGSKRLFNFFDSVIAIGRSAKDERLRYVKQVKVRAGAFRYDAGNVIIYEIVKERGFVHFEFKEFSTEKEHLRERTDHDEDMRKENVRELLQQGKTVREIGAFLGISKSTVSLIKQQIDKEGLSNLSNVSKPSKEDGALDSGNLFEEG